MRYYIHHSTTYTYSQGVILQPHLVRLRPRCNGDQSLLKFDLAIDPQPQGQTQILDPEGNAILRLRWAETPVTQLTLQVESEVETYCDNPFNFLLEPSATQLPIDYPTSLFTVLQPYLWGDLWPGSGIDPIAAQLGQEIAQAVEGNTILFLSELNQRICQTCKHQIRETGAPLPPSVTWQEKTGSCRDLTVLFMAACRAVGLASRFVSGYQEGDPDWQHRHLHAWAEVYLPGAGWRGYDPTQGLAVSDRHIALVATAWPGHAAPVTGAIRGPGATSQMDYRLTIEPCSEPGG